MRTDFLLRRVGEAFAERTASVAQEIAGLVRSSSKPEEVAAPVAKTLGTKFDWEYVAVISVDRSDKCFRLLAQFDRDGKLRVPTDYTQPLEEGMLGAVLREGKVLDAPDVTKEPKPWGYIGVSPARSAMCFPVRAGVGPNGPIRWILDLESSQFDSFPQPEQEILGKIVEETERTLQLWSEARLNRTLIATTDRGLVMVDAANRIHRPNREACRLLGLPWDQKWLRDGASWPLGNLIPDPDDWKALQSMRSVGEHWKLQLNGADGVKRRVQVTLLHRDDTFGDRVWRLEDLDQRAWGEGLKYMQAAVATVTAQTHGRLLLAGSLLRRARESSGLDSETSALLDRAASTLASADLTYERVAASYDAFKDPKRDSRLGPVDLGWELQRFRNSLPEDDRTAFALEVPGDPVAVRGDRGRLQFALRSLLGYLLALRSPESRLEVTLDRVEDGARLSIKLDSAWNAALENAISVPSEGTRVSAERDIFGCLEEPVSYHVEPASATVAQGLAAVRRVIEEHKGTLRCLSEQDRNICIEITSLPLQQEQVA